jgi:ABC-type Na+ efflux pump permease subunit
VQSQWVQYGLMVVFFGVLAAIPALWLIVGIKTYGTGDYHQP